MQDKSFRYMRKLLIFSLLIFSCQSYTQVFRFVVAKDGSGTDTTVQAAIDKCPDNARSIIYIKKGTYYGQTTIGTKTLASTKQISLIGEERDQVILTYDKSLPMVTKFEEATTFQIYAKDFYAENITFANSAGNTGQALALYTAGDKSIFKNCVLKGYQDTYRSKKGTRGYFKDCIIQGATDFIYAGGIIFFDDCELRCIKGGGYIAAPEDAYQTIPKTQTVCQRFLRLGFIFRNCKITAETGVPDNSYYLGRPWQISAGAFYLNCTLGKHISTKGWTEMGGNETTACFAEYKSVGTDGLPVDTTKRASWSFQLPKADVDNLLTTTGVYARVSTDLFKPEPVCVMPDVPGNIRTSYLGITWSPVTGAAGYMILKGGQYLTSTTDTVYADMTAGPGAITVKTIGSYGQLSKEGSVISGVINPEKPDMRIIISCENIQSDVPVKLKVFTTDGRCLASFNHFDNKFSISLRDGIYIFRIKTTDGKEFQLKQFVY